MATAVMHDREYENEEALRSLVTNHQRIRSPAPRRVKSSERYLPFIIVRPGDDDGQRCCPDDTNTAVMAIVTDLRLLIVTEHYDRLIDGDETSHCAYKGNDKR
jgi:hypothetical protein